MNRRRSFLNPKKNPWPRLKSHHLSNRADADAAALMAAAIGTRQHTAFDLGLMRTACARRRRNTEL